GAGARTKMTLAVSSSALAGSLKRRVSPLLYSPNPGGPKSTASCSSLRLLRPLARSCPWSLLVMPSPCHCVTVACNAQADCLSGCADPLPVGGSGMALAVHYLVSAPPSIGSWITRRL